MPSMDEHMPPLAIPYGHVAFTFDCSSIEDLWDMELLEILNSWCTST